MQLTNQAKGLFFIAPTPFDAEGRVDEASVDRMMDYYAEIGCAGVTVLGMMGEASKLDSDEALKFTRRVVRRAGQLQVVVGVSAPGFAAMRTLARGAMQAGAAGVMVAPAPSLRTDDQIIGYFRQAVEAIGAEVPFVLQDFPLALGVIMTSGVIRTIIQENPSCVMLKHEDWPGLDKISTLRRFEGEDSMRPISILVGNGGLFVDFEVERKVDGVMTGYSFPEMLLDVMRLGEAGQRDAAHDIFDAHLPLLRYEAQPGLGLAVRKYLLTRRGVIATDTQRAPASKLSATAIEEIEYLLARLARKDPRAVKLG